MADSGVSGVKPGADEAVGVLGVELDVDVRLVDPYGLGLWIAEQPTVAQASVLDGYWQGLGESPADLMLRMRTVGAELRRYAHLPTVAAAAEHLLHALRGIDEGSGIS